MSLLKVSKMIRRGNNKGASAVEFALLLLPLVLIVFGIIEFGLIMYNQQMLTNASREGARMGIIYRSPRPGATEIQTKVDNYLKDSSGNYLLVSFQSGVIPQFPAPSSPYLTQCPTPCPVGTECYLSVVVTYDYHPLILQGFGLVANPLHQKGETVMRCE
jgi:hypothetical protein